MQGKRHFWLVLRLLQLTYMAMALAAVPLLAFFVLRFGKRGLIFAIVYGITVAALHKKLAVWACPRCSNSFLGGHVEWTRFTQLMCCANCGLSPDR